MGHSSRWRVYSKNQVHLCFERRKFLCDMVYELLTLRLHLGRAGRGVCLHCLPVMCELPSLETVQCAQTIK